MSGDRPKGPVEPPDAIRSTERTDVADRSWALREERGRGRELTLSSDSTLRNRGPSSNWTDRVGRSGEADSTADEVPQDESGPSEADSDGEGP
jgi:hypothetical protein